MISFSNIYIMEIIEHNYDIYITNCNQRPSTTRLVLKMADKNQA